MGDTKDEPTKASSKQKQLEKFARRMAFSQLVDARQVERSDVWHCCDTDHQSLRDIHRHVALQHAGAVQEVCEQLLAEGHPQAKWRLLRPSEDKTEKNSNTVAATLPVSFSLSDEFPWLPVQLGTNESQEDTSGGRVLLFYKYRHLECPQHVCEWQKELCKRLKLTGKIRVAVEGINATLGGSYQATQLYLNSFLQHPLFSDMALHEFKESSGDETVFPEGLKVAVYKEICPMGIDPEKLSNENTATHLSPEEFHDAAHKAVQGDEEGKNSIFVDCRNFYESKIGQFQGALAPNIRKFSYWPEYVDKNVDLFKDKHVYMYCTGGIRCERGSAYLKEKGVCAGLYQLQGGIHKYIEKFPDGYFRGKMFVFDDRYTIKANDDIISNCVYCGVAWDKYQPCSSRGCCQLVLSCTTCRDKGLTCCCESCQDQGIGGVKEQCACTRARDRIPSDVGHAAPSVDPANTTAGDNN